MRKSFIGLLMFFALTSAAAAADPVEGLWKTQVDDGAYAYVEIAPCGAALCGVITRTFNDSGEYSSKNIGRQLVWGMQAGKSGKYGSGKVWQPSTDKVFSSKMRLKGNVLKVAGCVAGGLICKKQTWNRVQ